MKLEEIKKTIRLIVPDKELKCRILRHVQQPKGFHIDKPVRLAATFCGIIILCACFIAFFSLFINQSVPTSDLVIPIYSIQTAVQPTETRVFMNVDYLEKVVPVVLDTFYYDEALYRPQGYPINIKAGLAREMDKWKVEQNYLLDVVVTYNLPSFIYNGISSIDAQKAHEDELNTALNSIENDTKLSDIEKADMIRIVKNKYLGFINDFNSKYSIEQQKKWDSILSEVDKTFKREFIEVGERQYYSKFTRKELLQLAGSGVECMLVGNNTPNFRPAGYPTNMNDYAALYIDKSSPDTEIRIFFNEDFIDDKIPDSKIVATQQSLSDAIIASGIIRIERIEHYTDKNLHTTFDGILIATGEQLMKLAMSIPKMKFYCYPDLYDSEPAVSFYYNTHGDGFAANAGQNNELIQSVH
jgi:hypothetical protein